MCMYMPVCAHAPARWSIVCAKSTCASRMKSSPTLMSSELWPKQLFPDGILSAYPAHDPLWGANKVYIRYCTSDGHMGDREASNGTFGWHFRGRRVIAAAIALMKAKGLGNGR